MRKLAVLLLTLLMVLPVTGQAENTTDIDLISFTAEPLDIQGLRPDGWFVQENTLGVFVRGSDPGDPTALIIQSQEIEQEAFLQDIPQLLQLAGDLQLIDSLETDYLTWELYESTRMRGEQELLVDLAVSYNEDNGRTYFVVMQTTPFFYDSLHQGAFLNALPFVSPLQFYTDVDETFDVPLPVQWEATTLDDGYTQLTNPDNSVVVFVDSIESDDPIVASETFLAQINPDFDLSYDEELHDIIVIDDSDRIGGLENVTVIYWDNGDNETEFILQTVARSYEGTVYLTAIITTLTAINENEDAIIAIDNGFSIKALNDAETIEDEDTEDATQEE